MHGTYALIAVTRLTSELSTPFINNRWFLLSLNLKNSKMYLCNGFMILILFAIFRILPIIPLWKLFYNSIGTDSWNYVIIYDKFLILFTNIPLDVLNIYWFFKITDNCIRNLKKPKSI